MQKLNPDEIEQYTNEMESDFIPAVEGAEYYFALVEHKGRKVLCILDDSNKWRPTSYQEMVHLSRQ